MYVCVEIEYHVWVAITKGEQFPSAPPSFIKKISCVCVCFVSQIESDYPRLFFSLIFYIIQTKKTEDLIPLIPMK